MSAPESLGSILLRLGYLENPPQRGYWKQACPCGACLYTLIGPGREPAATCPRCFDRLPLPEVLA